MCSQEARFIVALIELEWLLVYHTQKVWLQIPPETAINRYPPETAINRYHQKLLLMKEYAESSSRKLLKLYPVIQILNDSDM